MLHEKMQNGFPLGGGWGGTGMSKIKIKLKKGKRMQIGGRERGKRTGSNSIPENDNKKKRKGLLPLV